MKISLDAGLMMHAEARQLITAGAEIAGATVIVTETARDTVKLNYHRFAHPHTRRRGTAAPMGGVTKIGHRRSFLDVLTDRCKEFDQI